MKYAGLHKQILLDRTLQKSCHVLHAYFLTLYDSSTSNNIQSQWNCLKQLSCCIIILLLSLGILHIQYVCSLMNLCTLISNDTLLPNLGKVVISPFSRQEAEMSLHAFTVPVTRNWDRPACKLYSTSDPIDSTIVWINLDWPWTSIRWK